jgi:hypothetical protein
MRFTLDSDELISDLEMWIAESKATAAHWLLESIDMATAERLVAKKVQEERERMAVGAEAPQK